jgi:Na+-driven multidrug efflux pump
MLFGAWNHRRMHIVAMLLLLTAILLLVMTLVAVVEQGYRGTGRASAILVASSVTEMVARRAAYVNLLSVSRPY